MKRYAIIVAGGIGARFGSTLPKQFVPLRNEPILMHTIRAFFNCDNNVQIVVALPSEYISMWKDLCVSHRFDVPHNVVEGGETRFESVKKALFSIPESHGVVAVHDGARPLVSTKLIENSYLTAERCGAAIPVIPVTDSIRQLDRNGSHALSRESLVAVQTPQTFRLEILKEAYTAAYSPMFTDDASVAEFRGTEITLLNGEVENIKITHPVDIKTAEWILAERNE